jgi:hypothetical protein
MRPTREHATHNQQTYFVSSQTWGRRQLFKNERWAKLFLDTLYHYRGTAFLLHEFVLCLEPADYPYSSASRAFELDDVPQRLKPLVFSASAARLEAAPLQGSQDQLLQTRRPPQLVPAAKETGNISPLEKVNN